MARICPISVRDTLSQNGTMNARAIVARVARNDRRKGRSSAYERVLHPLDLRELGLRFVVAPIDRLSGTVKLR